MGATLGVAVDAGVMDFGDSTKAIALINEVGRGTALGRILGEGVAVIDSLGLCYISFFERDYPMEKVTEIINAQYGLDLGYKDV